MNSIPDSVLAHLREVALEPDLAGTRYRVLQALGQGGMGAVYAAHDSELDRTVALKVLTVPSEDAAARLAREARILARLEHPGIVPVHDVGALSDGRVYYTMKYVQGSAVEHHSVRAAALTERLRVFLRTCEPVAFAHAHGVVHRDLKPANVMIGAYGEVLVLDWGIALLRDDPEAPGTVAGTPGYMAPEQQGGDTRAVDHRADIYALGAILRFLIEPETPPPLAAVAARAMQADPAGRYQSVEDLSADVLRFLDHEAVSAYPESWARRLRRVAARHQVAILLVAAYLAMRVILLVTRGG